MRLFSDNFPFPSTGNGIDIIMNIIIIQIKGARETFINPWGWNIMSGHALSIHVISMPERVNGCTCPAA
ncbi:hypothetical protein ACLKA6_006356 [Drosophila palustris]